ncbi:MAG TPA: vanadium-dependent haloperoxidase [Ilumatobacteraceae bacterium]|nr:vanadium-dependent haloperoxidase [Ilumatobacteraceae bacterium]
MRRSVGVGIAVVLAVTALVAIGVVIAQRSDERDATCERSTEHPEWSVARQWNEAVLAAIRNDFPAPTVHARNLFHSSAAMWDAWAAYDPVAVGVFVDEDRTDGDATAEEIVAAREEAMSYAAYRILVERYLPSPGAEASVTRLDELMGELCYDIAVTTTDGDDPAAFGNRIAATVLAETIDDGSNEANGYVADDYEPVNPPLVVDRSGTTMADPNRWQPLELEVMVAQNGLPLDETVQTFVGPHWGSVTSFALASTPSTDGLLLDPGPPPALGDPATDQRFKEEVNDVLRHSAMLDPAAETTIDISPASLGGNTLGTYDGDGHDVNPVTGEPYAPNVVALGDYGRVVAEFWADGPASETPPGHWNTVANTVSDDLETLGPLRIGGAGEDVDRLEWDTKMYLALNGAAHDSAIAAWGVKGFYDSSRPISMIRYMGGLGQSSDPAQPSYDVDGLLLEPDLVEVVTEESSAPGERHEAFADHIGEIAVWTWTGTPEDPEGEVAGVGWILAVDWVPYQRPTFVTPSFAGYVSGHSTFSRAAAEVLTGLTGSEYFPGGLGEWTIEADSLEFESGPDDEVVLQWATFADASDEAGISRLYGGIHVAADDLAGRVIGDQCGRDAWTLAQQYYDGSVAAN